MTAYTQHVCETEWGCTIRCDTAVAERSALIERVAACAGLAMLALAVSSATGAGAAPTPAALAFMPAYLWAGAPWGAAALVLLWIAERGLGAEVQIDREARELRQTVVNRRGKTRVRRALPFAEISSAYIRRHDDTHEGAQLFVRAGEGSLPLHVATGSEMTLRAIHGTLNHEIGLAVSPRRVVPREKGSRRDERAVAA